MNLAPVTELLRERIGLDPESLGSEVLQRAVATHMRALGLSATAEYATRLVEDALAFQGLVDDVTVPETWFFRGGEVFAYLVKHIRESVQQHSAGECYRILSVPCSTGEEPYTLALALVEAGVPPSAWQIEGVDLSSRLIERARQGRFGDFSFRQTASDLRQRYFRYVDGIWELAPAIRSLVCFSQGNLIAPFFLAGELLFDLVFCRNLLIYLHAAARRRVLDVLDRLLAPEGMVCMGHAEPLEFLDARFERIGPEGAFLYRRRRPLLKARDPQPMVAASLLRDSAPLPPSVSPVDLAIPADLLTKARQQADSGRLDDALATCQTHLTRCGPSPDLFGLMGVLYQARHETAEAQQCFQRALYLEPAHHESLTHLMLLCQEQGDHRQAERLRRRLERVAPEDEA
jgi:chemotaxis protein methyltransferase WspC